MTPLRCLLISVVPLFVLATCKDDKTEKEPNGSGGSESMAGEGGRDDGGSDSGGSAGTGRGGTGGRGGASTGGSSGDGGEAGTGGEPDGGEAGRGGAAGSGARGGNAGGGMGGNAGNAGRAGGGAAGSGGVTCTTVTLPLMNADFDEGTSGWTQYDEEAGAVRPIIIPAASVGIMAVSDPNVARLGGVNDAAAGMFQAIEIPEGAVSMTLTGYGRVITEEGTSAPIDVFTIQLYEDAQTTTGLVGDFAVLSNEDPSNDWVEFTGTLDVAVHAGHVMELDVYAETDGSLFTEFFVDSLALTASVCL